LECDLRLEAILRHQEELAQVIKTTELAAKRLKDFAQGPWENRSAIAQCWRSVWQQFIPLFAYPNEIRKIISTTNAIESCFQ
jgi:transposase-like protein